MSKFDKILQLFKVKNPVGYTAEQLMKAKTVVMNFAANNEAEFKRALLDGIGEPI